MKQFNVGIIGATGMVGQRFATLLENHPWFHVKVLAASPRSAGRTYKEAVGARWCMQKPMPKAMEDMIIKDATADIEAIAKEVDFVFCAVDMKKDEIRALEEAYAKAECPVISNNSAHRFTKDVPMIVPELNADHAAIIPAQRKRLGTKRGFIAVKSNCSLQSYVPALFPLSKFGIERVLVCTYQAISGAGKTLENCPEIIDNVIPYIGGEEEKSEREYKETSFSFWHSLKFLWSETMPLPEDVCPILQSALAFNQFFASSVSLASSSSSVRPRTFNTCLLTCPYSLFVGKTLSGMSVMSTHPKYSISFLSFRSG